MKIKLSLLFLICYLISFSQNFDKKVNDLILNYENEVIELRHWFHENAELSNREFKTAKRIEQELIKIGFFSNIFPLLKFPEACSSLLYIITDIYYKRFYLLLCR